MSASIAIIQFPGSNTERETLMACRRVGLNPVEFLWNDATESLSNFDGFIIVGGFAYEDRSRAGVIAALDPIMNQIKVEANKGKPVLGICNGAQILVESGLVPGLDSHRVGVALTDNKRVKGGHVVGVGYYNTWANLKMSVPPDRCAFTRHLNMDENGDAIFASMKDFIENENPITGHSLSFDRPHYEIEKYEPNPDATKWVIDMIITDNEAVSVHNALGQLGYDVSISRQTHWEILVDNEREPILQKIDATGELYNSNKEFISKASTTENIASLLVRQKEDMVGRAKLESLTERFEIGDISEIKRGVIWNVTINGGNFETILKEILDTHILFNPLSHECYKIN
mgnify:CR=1 FL=1